MFILSPPSSDKAKGLQESQESPGLKMSQTLVTIACFEMVIISILSDLSSLSIIETGLVSAFSNRIFALSEVKRHVKCGEKGSP